MWTQAEFALESATEQFNYAQQQLEKAVRQAEGNI
jgi:hypothetical protein